MSDRIGHPLTTATISRCITAVRELLAEALCLGYWRRDRLDYLVNRTLPPEVAHDHHPAGPEPKYGSGPMVVFPFSLGVNSPIRQSAS